MAGQIPDPHSLTTWEDAFQHPLPAVRKLEQQLRKNIDDNREKLRVLVGASYRDLLGTAERIIEMDEQMQTVEATLGEIGRKCNARTVERVADNHARMRRTLDDRHGGKYAVMAQTKVLQNALMVVVRLVRGGGDTLLAAKLLVLSRLLYKNVSESSDAPPVIEDLRRKLASARKKLLAYMDRTIARPMGDKHAQAHSLCAYALVTSSTPKEVLKYFLQIRYQQLETSSESPSETDMLEMLELYSQTLLDTRDLFPRRFAEVLAQLAKVPLLQDEQVQACSELSLDVHGSWIATDIQTFTPWVRHEQLTSTEVGEAVSSWTSHAQSCLLDGLQDCLKEQSDPRSVFRTRQKVVAKYLSLGSKLHSDTHMKAVEEIRSAFLQRLRELAATAGSLEDLFQGDEDMEARLAVGEQHNLWDLATEDMDLSHGALKLRQAVIRSRNGRTEFVNTATQKLDDWMERLQSTLDLTGEMRASKWDNDVDLDLDIPDDIEPLLQALNKQDPEAITTSLRDATAISLNRIIDSVTAAGATTKHAAYYLRVWREVDRRRRSLQSQLDMPPAEISLDDLYRNVALGVSNRPVAEYAEALKDQSHVAVALWDSGSPPLPIQPSPATFHFLATLSNGMTEVGSDLWSVLAVEELKGVVLSGVAEQLNDPDFTTLQNSTVSINGHAEDGKDEVAEGDEEKMVNGTATISMTSNKNRLLQHLFDMQYLRRVLLRRSNGDVGNGLDGVVKRLRETLELDDAACERLEKSAGEYWKRTYLLFGLLAP